MDDLRFAGSSLKDLRGFPEAARRAAGYQLSQVQLGHDPSDWKALSSVAPNVKEIRIHHSGEFRVIYFAKIQGFVYVLHAFQKKTQKTPKKEIEIAKARLKLVNETHS